MFDSSGLTVDQNFATSADGTRVPYFVIRRKEGGDATGGDAGGGGGGGGGGGSFAFDGENPTLVDAYGGFEISMLPGYSAGVGAAWLERGGVKVVANIRGGGECEWGVCALCFVCCDGVCVRGGEGEGYVVTW